MQLLVYGFDVKIYLYLKSEKIFILGFQTFRFWKGTSATSQERNDLYVIEVVILPLYVLLVERCWRIHFSKSYAKINNIHGAERILNISSDIHNPLELQKVQATEPACWRHSIDF